MTDSILLKNGSTITFTHTMDPSLQGCWDHYERLIEERTKRLVAELRAMGLSDQHILQCVLDDPERKALVEKTWKLLSLSTPTILIKEK